MDGSDGCTGFWIFEWLFPSISQCCRAHDIGGSDGMLLDCLQQNLPPWAWAIAGFCVAVMILLRPIYHWLTHRGSSGN
jgi:hypothetical protein